MCTDFMFHTMQQSWLTGYHRNGRVVLKLTILLVLLTVWPFGVHVPRPLGGLGAIAVWNLIKHVEAPTHERHGHGWTAAPPRFPCCHNCTIQLRVQHGTGNTRSGPFLHKVFGAKPVLQFYSQLIQLSMSMLKTTVSDHMSASCVS